MAYKQLVTPNINIGATSGYCLGYVDNAIGAVYPYRSYSAQIAYEKAKVKGWVTNNQNFPKNVWFVLFWSIDNTAQQGLGHVALAYVSSNGNLQIHDSEVHSGARNPYGSLSELASWFGSGGIKLTYLGWSVGCDNVKLIEPIATSKTTNIKKTNKKGVAKAMFVYKLVPKSGATQLWGVNGTVRFHFSTQAQFNHYAKIVKANGGDTTVNTWKEGSVEARVLELMAPTVTQK